MAVIRGVSTQACPKLSDEGPFARGGISANMGRNAEEYSFVKEDLYRGQIDWHATL